MGDDTPAPEPGRELFDDQLAGPCPYWTPIGSNGGEACALVLGHSGDHLWESEVEAPVGVPVGDDTPAPTAGNEGDMPDPDTYMESELFVAGAISTLPQFAHRHPAWCLPIARRALEALSEWEPSDASVPVGDDTPAPTAQWTVDEDGVSFTDSGGTVWWLSMEALHRTWAPFIDAGTSAEAYVTLADLVRRAGAAPDLTDDQVERARRSLWALAAEVPSDVYNDVKAAWKPVIDAAALVREDTDQ